MYESLQKTEVSDKRNICDKQMIAKYTKGIKHGSYLLNISKVTHEDIYTQQVKINHSKNHNFKICV